MTYGKISKVINSSTKQANNVKRQRRTSTSLWQRLREFLKKDGLEKIWKIRHYNDFLETSVTLSRGQPSLQEAEKMVRFDNVINLQLTSGTTGAPKAAMLTSLNLINNARFVGEGLGIRPGDVLCCPPPLFHCFGMVLDFLAAFTHGISVLLPLDVFSAARTLDAIHTEKGTILHGVPTMFLAELEVVASTGRRPTSLRTCVAAGSSVTKALVKDLNEQMGVKTFLIGYGMTETSPISFMTLPEDTLEKKLTTVGRLFPHVEGENIYPAEIEERLLQHPAIIEASVIGINDAKYGEVAKLSKDVFWVGDGADFHVSEFPKTGSGKYQKPILLLRIESGGSNIHFPPLCFDVPHKYPSLVPDIPCWRSAGPWGHVWGLSHTWLSSRVLDMMPLAASWYASVHELQVRVEMTMAALYHETLTRSAQTEEDQVLGGTANLRQLDGDSAPGLSSLGADAELLKRISTIESLLVKMNPDGLEPTPSFDTLPPIRVIRNLVDTYFARVHDQPYSFHHETDFRQRLQNNAHPQHLLFAVSALAIRFMNHQYYSGRLHEASAAYSKQAWILVLTDHLMVLNNITLPVIQTISILAVVDYTAGRASAGWLKVGLAARLSQGLDLMTEPPTYIAVAEQEERRRTFWSIYILDRLISCARSRPPAISDDDCNVQLPCDDDDELYTQDIRRGAQTLRPLLSWDTNMNQPPRGFVLAILMAWVLGRCTKYAHGRSEMETVPPCDPKSDFMAINSSLMLLESYLNMEENPVPDLIREVRQSDTKDDAQQLGHLIFARALFHLCHCLLNHPFLLRVRLVSFANKVPRSFSVRALQLAEENAKKLTDLLSSASEGGILVESSFYTYCVAVSGAIHTMAHKSPQKEDNLGQYDASKYFQQSIDVLNRLGHLWPMAKNIETRLRRFHDLFPTHLGLFHPSLLTSPSDPSFDDLLWSVVDYNTLAGELPKWDVFPSISALPSPSLWDLDIVLPDATQDLDLQVHGLFPESASVFT
ncbi:fungal-specific transcription factor domain-containing protein [Paramyrothecium foliicola]|nr:fungal-specific transcription factor domain-containing protein [Paramyrothecium foliicola]